MEPPSSSSREIAGEASASPGGWFGLIAGPLAMIVWILFVDPGSLTPQAHRFAGIMLLTVIWWITEPIPIAATGVLGASLAVVLETVPVSGTSKGEAVRTVLAPFADPSVVFLLGGIFIGRAMTRHGLDRRLALSILCTRWAGRSPYTVLAAVGFAVAAISMWISNTAATAMMYPVTLGIIRVLARGQARRRTSSSVSPEGSETDRTTDDMGDPAFVRSSYAASLLLMTAYASSIGGIATPIGTATNVVAKGFFKEEAFFGRSVDFLHWSLVGIPTMLLMTVGLFLWLRFLTRAGDLDMGHLRDYLRLEYEGLGTWKRGERNTLAVFLVVVGCWTLPGMLEILGMGQVRQFFDRHLPEEIVAALCPVLLFLVPLDRSRRRGTLDVSDLNKVDWGTILLFGSGLSLGGLMVKTGLAREIGESVFDLLGSRDIGTITAVTVLGGVLLSEITSNAATASALIPVTMSLCQQAEMDPIPALVGVTLGASFGSAFPVSTPPNAIVYSSGLIPARRMIVAGLGLDVLAAVVIWCVLRVAHAFHWTPF